MAGRRGPGGRQTVTDRELQAFAEISSGKATRAAVAAREGLSKSTIDSWLTRVRDHLSDERHIAAMGRP